MTRALWRLYARIWRALARALPERIREVLLPGYMVLSDFVGAWLRVDPDGREALVHIALINPDGVLVRALRRAGGVRPAFALVWTEEHDELARARFQVTDRGCAAMLEVDEEDPRKPGRKVRKACARPADAHVVYRGLGLLDEPRAIPVLGHAYVADAPDAPPPTVDDVAGVFLVVAGTIGVLPGDLTDPVVLGEHFARRHA